MDQARKPPRPQEQGIALLLVIWALALLSAIAVAVAADGRSVRRIAHNLEQAARDRALVEGGIRWGMAQLLDGRPERRLPLDGRPQLIEIGTSRVEVAVEAETGKFDLNTSQPAVLENLLLQSGATAAESRRVAAAVENFRKANRPEPGRLRRPAFLETLDLRRVTGLDEEIYRRILPFITVYSGTARLDPAVAPKQVLLAVPGLTEGQVEASVRARQQSTATPTASLTTAATSVYLGPSRPTIFRIRSSVQAGADPLATGSAIVELTGQPNVPLRLHDWMLEAR